MPFNDIEEIASSLGIPFDSPNALNNSSNFITSLTQHNSYTSTIDPRSSEFQELLNRLAKAIDYVQDHRYYYDSNKYLKWLEHLQMRATSLIAKSMRELLDSAGIICKEITQKQLNKKIKMNPDEIPLESNPIYQKFRGLSYRMRELSNLLQWNKNITLITNNNQSNRRYEGFSNITYQQSSKFAVEEIIEAVKQGYVTLRVELLNPLIREYINYASHQQIFQRII